MTSRVVLNYSNRVPDPNSTHAGGLTVACQGLKEGIWMGPNDKGMERVITPHGGLTYEKFPCPREMYQASYLLCNEQIWLGFHGIARNYPWTISEKNLNAYENMSRLAAQEIKAAISRFPEPDKVVLNIQDFHNLSLARCLNEIGVTNPKGLFLHIPFPSKYNLGVLPEPSRAQVQKLMLGLLDYDQLGFQTPKDAQNFRVFAQSYGGRMLEDGAVAYNGRRIGVGVFHVSIDPDYGNHITDMTAIDPDVREALADDRKMILGVDRIDPAKNLESKIRAYGKFLEKNMGAENGVFFAQVAPMSREQSHYYTDERDAVEFAAEAINRRFGSADRPAIRLLNKTIDHSDVYRLHAHADVFAINSVDGAMLGAYEFPAAKHAMMKFDPKVRPGTLIISNEAGASTIVGDNAIRITAGNVTQLATAFSDGLNTPPEIRLRNQELMMEKILAYNSAKWQDDFVTATEESHNRRLEPLLVDSLEPFVHEVRRLLPLAGTGKSRQLRQ